MGNDVTKEFSSFLSPDGLRSTLHMLNHFYDNHTKKRVGYEDIEGSQYVGNIHNFGSELLIETRKILMDKASLKNVFIDNTFDFYFDIQYSELIDTYDQQRMLKAVLENGVLLSNKEYYIRFDDCDERYVLRAESWSDPTVYRDHFVYTTTPPTFVIVDKDSGDVEEIQLRLSDKTDIDTSYYFHFNPTTTKMIHESDLKNHTFILKIDESMVDIPVVWMCVDIFRFLPNIGFTNNTDMLNKPLLTVGTDGHNVSKLYPYIYGENNVPSKSNGKWFIKVTPVYGGSFVESVNTANNYQVAIKDITFINSESIGSTPNDVKTITFNKAFIELKLSNDVEWLFKTPRHGDYDYDGTTYNNQCYGYIELDTFLDNIHETSETRKELKPAFDIIFDESYLHKYEGICGNAVSGIHVESSSEYSDNGIPSKNGVIHNLGDFDGLPTYFRHLLDRSINRSHVELYTIRDDVNNVNQETVDKQTSALILDSAFPQTKVLDVSDLNIVIRYSGNRTFDTVGESISPTNSLSEITYIDRNTFGNFRLPENGDLEKFVYHGGRVFSLGMVGLDPELEYGRVYCIGNDPASYDNNDTSNHKKAERCLARICDIPTEFTQLMHVEGHAPTFVIDKEYVRTEVPFTNEDLTHLWNTLQSKIVVKTDSDPYWTNSTFVFKHTDDLDTLFDEEFLKSNYPNHVKMNTTIDLRYQFGDFEFRVYDSGNGYNVNDTFTFIIGGVYFDGTVESVDSGHVISISISQNMDAVINTNNLDGPNTVFETTTKTGNGSGLKIELAINQSYWDDSFVQETIGFSDGVIACKFDEFDNIWIWKYDSIKKTWYRDYQFTGTPIVENMYDEYKTQSERSLIDVFLNNLLCQNKFIDVSVLENDMITTTKESTVPSDVDINSGIDVSDMIKGINVQDAYYTLESSNNPTHDINIISRQSDDDVNRYVLPKHHQINLYEYHNKTNTITYTFDTSTQQPIPIIYNPNKNATNHTTPICSDMATLNAQTEFTFSHIIDDVDSYGHPTTNVYVYDEYTPSPNMTELETTLSTYSREQLMTYIVDHFGEDAHPALFKDEESPYSRTMLISYIMENSYNDPVYKKNDIRLVHPDEQPRGGYDVISLELHKPRVYIDGMLKNSIPTFVFRIDVDPEEFGSLKNYRIKDDCGNDVTENSLLIYNNKGYVFINGWKPISLKEET